VRVIPRLPERDVGPVTVTVLLAAYAALWYLAEPPGQSARSFLGQLFGAESILLLSLALVLISSLPWVERWFDGIDRAAIWHRRLAIAGLVLLIPHIALSQGGPGARGVPLAVAGTIGLVGLALWAILPRWRSVVPRPLRPVVTGLAHLWPHPLRRLFGGYDRWRGFHRVTGLFVAAAFVHGLLDGTPFHGAPVLRWSYVAIGGIGLAFYAYREILARYFLPFHDYEVDEVRTLDTGLTELTLRPLGKPLTFTPGQFAFVFIEAKDGWHRHPFTIASGAGDEALRFTVKGLGDYTAGLPLLVEPGMPAVIGGPHGYFDHRRGTKHQVWVAAGVGVAPFLSWLRSADHDLPQSVDLFYTTQSDPPLADEITEIVARHDPLSVHLVETDRDGRLTPEGVLATVPHKPSELSVFMCGPAPMLRQFERAMRRGGVRRANIHREYFDWR
jgi:predicted ferric reductase